MERQPVKAVPNQLNNHIYLRPEDKMHLHAWVTKHREKCLIISAVTLIKMKNPEEDINIWKVAYMGNSVNWIVHLVIYDAHVDRFK